MGDLCCLKGVFGNVNSINRYNIPDHRSVRISSYAQVLADRVKKMDNTMYCRGKVILSSKDSEQLDEAARATENFLSYNGSWDLNRNDYETREDYVCEVGFKWNGYQSIKDKICSLLRLPAGVNSEVVLNNSIFED